jgi:hypothetical protein
MRVIASAQDRKVPSIFGPIVQHGKHPQAFWPDERFGAQDGKTHSFSAIFLADLFGQHFGLTVGANPLHLISL